MSLPATVSREAQDIAQVVTLVNRSQIQGIQQIGEAIDSYILRRADEPGGKVRAEAIKRLQAEVDRITDTTVDLHRTYQIYGAMRVYLLHGPDRTATRYSPSVWKELATTCQYDRETGVWEAKDGIDPAAVTEKLGTDPTVTKARALMGDLLPKRAIRHVAKAPDTTPPSVPPCPIVEAVKDAGIDLVQEACEEIEVEAEQVIEPKQVAAVCAAGAAAAYEPPPTKDLAASMKHALGLQSKAREVLELIRFNDGEDTVRPVEDQADIWAWLAKDLADDEIAALVRGLSKFDSSWDTLRHACKAENDRRKQAIPL